jgi:TolB protein
MCRLLCGLVVVFVGVLATAASPALGAFPGKNGKIAFVSDRDGGDDDIWTMNPDGSDPVNLTPGAAGSDGAPNWSADGRKIVFASNRETPDNPTPPGFPGPDHEIFVMNADGSDVTQITDNELDDELPAWSPDGRRIVFSRDYDPIRGRVDLDLLTIRSDGRRERILTNTRGVQEYGPNWSPNGRMIAFVSELGGDGEIWTMNRRGSNQRQLTFNDAGDEFPNWSPDGRRIAFHSDPFEVYTMDADGSHRTRLTFGTGGHPAWSPDGRQIAFLSFPEGNGEIYTMRPDGASQVNRTRYPAADDYVPDWQPVKRHHGHHGGP